MNVLVIEDGSNERNLLTYIIEKNFFDVRVYKVNNEEEALAKLREKKISLIFISTKLKAKPGIVIGEKIRKYREHSLIPIVFISDDILNLIEAFKKVHCYDYLTRPYKEEEIKKIVQLFLDEYKDDYRLEKSSIFIDVNSSVTRKIYHDDIIFIEYRDRCCYIYLKDEVISWKGKSLNKVLLSLNNEHIVQTHKSFAVNVKKVFKVTKISEKGWEIEFEDILSKALLGYKYRNEVLRRMK